MIDYVKRNDIFGDFRRNLSNSEISLCRLCRHRRDTAASAAGVYTASLSAVIFDSGLIINRI
jgi:hypothetical protein